MKGISAAAPKVVAASAAAGVAVLTTLVVSADGVPFAVDTALHEAGLDRRSPATVGAARMLTATGTGVIVYVLVALAGWLACRRAKVPAVRRVPVVLAALAVLGCGQLVRMGVRTAVDRSRPPAADWATHAHQASFPSGHATTSALVAGLLAWAVLRALPGARGRVAAVCCGLWAAGVAGTRVFLGVHWFSDLVGGWLLAACWLALTLPLLGLVARRWTEAPSDAPEASSSPPPQTPPSRPGGNPRRSPGRAPSPGRSREQRNPRIG
ncbi:phosphatase PAP2 family protein [Streptomyces sp. NPDC053048]|uniref:phosphatase PAP2 family protein n=1 Tax=Streptomyces sp. NPDC053048 TaxID=3365694 RepID=UPI0037D50C4B